MDPSTLGGSLHARSYIPIRTRLPQVLLQCSVYRFRPLRAGVFITFGLSGIAPATHYCVVNGWDKAVDQVAIGWLILMGCLYITGALLYAVRIPERFFPGKLDIWVRSFIDVVKRRADA